MKRLRCDTQMRPQNLQTNPSYFEQRLHFRVRTDDNPTGYKNVPIRGFVCPHCGHVELRVDDLNELGF